MKVLVVGGGGREHAIIKKLSESPLVGSILAVPGNGGISFHAHCENIKALDLDKIVDYALANKVDFALVGPDDPLAQGAVDKLEAAGIPSFGPTAKAATIESSKVFSKDLMMKYGIPTASYQIFNSADRAVAYLEKTNDFPIVIKADGLALGKGVIIATCLEEAIQAVKDIMTERIFGDSGNRIIIEEYLTGPEVSVLAFTDSISLVPMVSSMDHKRALDGNLGPNTGGMGALAPNPFYTDQIAQDCMEKIFLPTMQAMNKEGRPFKGCLYFGLMLTEKGPKVIEYNCRFGDPEAQVVLPLLKSDLFTIMKAVRDERLSELSVEFEDASAICLIAASGGYPGKYDTGLPISGLIQGQLADVSVFHAGTKCKDGKLLTSGGRVLGLTATDKDLKKAASKAYSAMKSIHFKGMHYRKDIGLEALNYMMSKEKE